MSLVITSVSDKPFDKIYINLVGPLPEAMKSNKYILSMVDELRRVVSFANTLAKVLLDEIINCYSLPRAIVIDQGANFSGEVLKSSYKRSLMMRKGSIRPI